MTNTRSPGGYTACIRDIVLSRLRKVGMTTLRLPLTITGFYEPHVPILVSKNLSTASRIIVVFGEPIQDLGVWAYRSIGTVGINAGSAVPLADHVLHQHQKGSPEEKTTADTALVIANTGQLVWHAAGRKAITMPSWLALPRRSAVDPPQTMTERNNILGNENWQEHVECVFREILAARGKLVRADAKIDIVGVAEGGLGAVRYLYDDCMFSYNFPYPVVDMFHWFGLLLTWIKQGRPGVPTSPQSPFATLFITRTLTSSTKLVTIPMKRPAKTHFASSCSRGAVHTFSPPNPVVFRSPVFTSMAAIASPPVRN